MSLKYLLENVETERLHFRLLNQNDFQSWLPLFYKTEILHFLGLDPQKTPEELCTHWFNKVLKRYEEDQGGLNVLIDKKTGEFIGQAGLLVQTVEEEQYLEIGYSILPQYWGRGYASEAAIKCKEEGFERNFSPLLISMVHQDNVGSEKVAQRNGMRIIKHLPSYHDMPFNMYGITKKTYNQEQ